MVITDIVSPAVSRFTSHPTHIASETVKESSILIVGNLERQFVFPNDSTSTLRDFAEER